MSWDPIDAATLGQISRSLKRQEEWLQSIAESLAKLANPIIVVNPEKKERE